MFVSRAVPFSPSAWALAAAAAGLLGCHGSRPARDEPTHVSQAPVAFDAPPVYPDIIWTSSLEEARTRAADEHKPMIVFFRAAWSKPSVMMESTIWRDSRVLAEAGRFVALRIDLTPYYGVPLPEAYAPYDVMSVPTTIIVSSDGRILGRFEEGGARPTRVASAMRDAK
jgi:thiol:disulfide interchange protein